jgi:hypothetical protein
MLTKATLFAVGDFLTHIGERHDIRFLIYNPVTWLRFLISARRNGKAFAHSLKSLFPEVVSCADIGAGAGGYVRECSKVGYSVIGYEYSVIGRILALLQLVRLNKFDCNNRSSWPEIRVDMVFSIEVAEHLPKELAGSFVECITRCSDLVLFTAALPNQPGQGHVNCQPLSYWREKFESLGFTYSEEDSLQFSEHWNANGFRGFASKNLQIFRRSTNN